MGDREQVLIVGGGVGGIEAALALRSVGFDSVTTHMVSAQRYFSYRPLAVGSPFGLGSTWRVDLTEIAQDVGFTFELGETQQVNAEAKRIETVDGKVIEAEAIIFALGARPIAAIHGVFTFRGPSDVQGLAKAIGELPRDRESHIVFAAPSATTWTLPIYELALLTADWGQREGLNIEIVLITAETAPLRIFGEDASNALAERLQAAGIRVLSESSISDVDGGKVRVPMSSSLSADLVVALPQLVGPKLPGLPHDDYGFTPVDDQMHVLGYRDIYAVGDMVALPIKQGGLAAQQADVAASTIARKAGSPVPEKHYEPVLRGLVLTGEEPLFVRSPGQEREMFRPDDKIGTAPWWPQHKIMGRYLASYLEANSHLVHVESP